MNILKTLAGVLMFLSIFGCSGKPPVSVVLNSNQMVQSVKYVTITALEDVTVKAISFNRGGSCEIYSYRNLPAKLSFGNEFNVSPGCKDKVIEAEIVTDKGGYTFTF